MSMSSDNGDVTFWLRRAQRGDREAENLLIEKLYGELHRIAMQHLRHERRDHTLQATALVHDAYFALVRDPDQTWQSRSHFLAIASRVMRHLLVDHARAKIATKRGGEMTRVQMNDGVAIVATTCEQLVILHEALDRMASMDSRLATIVEMRFFGGMTEDEVAEVLGMNVRTIKRDWSTARAWLASRLGNGSMSSSANGSR